jgi:SAM-dependent methyltransferase/uncharacterized protein YbaR (Trm112 family)
VTGKDRTNSFLLNLLRCPLTGSPLRYLPFAMAQNGTIPDGALVATTECWYPIMDGIPRLLEKQGRIISKFAECYGEQIRRAGLFLARKESEDPSTSSTNLEQVQQSFGFKWNSQPLWGMRDGSAEVTKEWMLKKYGWKEEAHFRDCIRKRKVILDAGTGLGREIVHFAEANSEAFVFGMDLSESVLSAVKHTCGYPGTMILQADLMKPPFAESTFDFILSEGVLHHTPDTRAALHSLVRLLAPGGEIGFYVYREKGPLREFADDFLREKISRMTPEEALEAVKPLTLLGQSLSRMQGEVEIPEIPLLQTKAGSYPVQRLVYWNFIKCFWNESLSFEENNLVNLDWYHPRYAWRHTLEEIRGWLFEFGMEPIWENEEEAGITIRAIQK